MCPRLLKNTRKTAETRRSTKELETAIKNTAVMMFAGGADTTVSSMSSMVLAMSISSAVQKKAHDEIDAIVGSERLPKLEDRDSLPYINALVKETLRWLPVAPMGMAHKTDDDVRYGNFDIPKGSLLLPAIWWFLHDPQVYESPSSFDPTRYLEPRNEPDPTIHVFGYGRRVCPGRFLADDTLFLTISRVLAAFDIGKTVDGEGNEIEPQINLTPGAITHPLDFPFTIKPRNNQYVELIRKFEGGHPWAEGSAKFLSSVFANNDKAPK